MVDSCEREFGRPSTVEPMKDHVRTGIVHQSPAQAGGYQGPLARELAPWVAPDNQLPVRSAVKVSEQNYKSCK